MKQNIHIAILAGLLLLSASSSVATGQTSGKLLSVRYSIRAGYSRVTLGLEGKTQFTVSGQDKRLKIVLGKTAAGSMYDGARMRFSSGLVDRVNVDQTKGDSAIIVVTFKSKARFKVQQAEQQKALYVDVYSDTTSARKTIAATKRAAKTGTKSPSASIVSQVHQEVASSIAPHDTLNVVNQVSAGTQGDRPLANSVLTIALVLLLSAAGTALVLVLLHRRWKGKPSTNNKQEIVTSIHSLTEKKNSEGQRERTVAIVEEREEESQTNSEIDQEASALILAKQYRRGQGELNLSFNLKARQTENQWAQVIKKLRETNVGEQDQLKLAKKHGIGRGELELAMRVHQRSIDNIAKEELV